MRCGKNHEQINVCRKNSELIIIIIMKIIYIAPNPLKGSRRFTKISNSNITIYITKVAP